MAENMGDKSVYIRAFWPREISQSTSLRSIQSNGGIYSKSTRLGRLARLNPQKATAVPAPSEHWTKASRCCPHRQSPFFNLQLNLESEFQV